MMHLPIQFTDLSFTYPHKTCFADFSGQILYGNRIAIIGRNGCGKSKLLNVLRGSIEPTCGEVVMPCDMQVGFVPQVIEAFDSLSGGQRFNKALTEALSKYPNILMLDEPTNHLDRDNRRSLLRMLDSFHGTLVIVSHDIELLRHTVDTIWHIEDGKVHVFSGSYDDYIDEMKMKRTSIQHDISGLERQKREAHLALMKEQSRAKNSRARGEKQIQQRKWPTLVSSTKVRNAVETAGRKASAIHHKKQELRDQLSALRLPEVICPTFTLPVAEHHDAIICIRGGRVSYHERHLVLEHVNLSLYGKDRLAIIGNNGSGKSTLVKAILNDIQILKEGDWITPKRSDIGYLDQHYGTLTHDKTVFETISDLAPNWSYIEIRKHLNDFLFRKNEEVDALVSTLSGGEKARLSLAHIAASVPKLLILDEMTNNLDRETRDHVIQVLQAYPGAMIVISHDDNFLTSIGVTDRYVVNEHRMMK